MLWEGHLCLGLTIDMNLSDCQMKKTTTRARPKRKFHAIMHFRFVSMIHSFVLGGHFAVYESKESNADTLQDEKKSEKKILVGRKKIIIITLLLFAFVL